MSPGSVTERLFFFWRSTNTPTRSRPEEAITTKERILKSWSWLRSSICDDGRAEILDAKTLILLQHLGPLAWAPSPSRVQAASTWNQ